MFDVMQELQRFSRVQAAFASDCWRAASAALMQPPGAASPPATESLQTLFATHYQRLLAPTLSLPDPAEAAPDLVAAIARCQRAAQALAAYTNSIAIDASRRLVVELARAGPSAAPVTTLRELRDLWIECGERAWAAAVHESGYADAQAEWLASVVELESERRKLAGSGSAP